MSYLNVQLLKTDSPNADDSCLIDSSSTIDGLLVTTNEILRCVATLQGNLEMTDDVNLVIGWYRYDIEFR